MKDLAILYTRYGSSLQLKGIQNNFIHDSIQYFIVSCKVLGSKYEHWDVNSIVLTSFGNLTTGFQSIAWGKLLPASGYERSLS